MAVSQKLPEELVTPCPKAARRRGDVQTDVDIVSQWKREEVRADCNENKLKAIAKIQKRSATGD